MNKNMSILTIGVPILNGEKIIRKKLAEKEIEWLKPRLKYDESLH